MARPVNSLALCTAVYPGVEPYLADWHRSVRRQTDRDVRIWIALDALEPRAAMDAMGGDPGATWVRAERGDTVAQVRQRVLSRLLDACDAVVLVDSDDILHPTRVAAARAALEKSDLAACSLRLVDAKGGDMGLTLGLPPGLGPDEVLPRHNVFGLSNTAWRADLLRRCLPIPTDIELVDWFLATRAWLGGASLSFDSAVGMDYRQHGSNAVRVRPPFAREQVIRDTERVLKHFHGLRSSPSAGAIASREERLDEVACDIERFSARVLRSEECLERYLVSLNALDPPPLWWSSVAHPNLRHMWT